MDCILALSYLEMTCVNVLVSNFPGEVSYMLACLKKASPGKTCCMRQKQNKQTNKQTKNPNNLDVQPRTGKIQEGCVGCLVCRGGIDPSGLAPQARTRTKKWI